MSATMKKERNLTVDPEEVYPEVKDMIHKLSWSYFLTYGGEFDDWLGIAHSGFMEACYTFKEGKGMKFSSWCYFCVWSFLKDVQMKKAKESLYIVSTDEVPEGSYTQPVGWSIDIEEVKKTLIPEAKEILNLLLNVPEELRPHITTPSILIRKVKKYMKERGFKDFWWEKGMKDLRTKLSPLFT